MDLICILILAESLLMYTFTLADLKLRLQSAKNFGEVWHFFLDHFGENEAFMAKGERVRHPLVEGVVEQVAKQVLKRSIDAKQILLTKLADDRFIHGSGLFGGTLIAVMYFEDIDAGMLSLTTLGSEKSGFIRFSLQQPGRTIKPSAN